MSFEFDSEPLKPKKPKKLPGWKWLSMFTAVLAATFLSGCLLLLCVRMYVKWSVKEFNEGMQKEMQNNPPQKDIDRKR